MNNALAERFATGGGYGPRDPEERILPENPVLKKFHRQKAPHFTYLLKNSQTASQVSTPVLFQECLPPMVS